MANLYHRSMCQVRIVSAYLRQVNHRSLSSAWHITNLRSMGAIDSRSGVGFKPTMQVRSYLIRDVPEPSEKAPRPAKKDYEERVFKALNTFDRYPKGKTLTLDTHFTNDMGLDSLDHVELIVAIETEFNCEIPDEVAEKLMTPRQIWEYLCEKDKVPEKRGEYGFQTDFKF